MPQIDFAYWGLQTLAMIITAVLLPGFRVSGPLPALITVVLLGFINSSVWSAALFFHIPDTVSMEVATLLFANAVIFALVVKLVPGITFDSYLPMLVAPLLFTITSILISKYLSDVDWNAVWQVIANVLEHIKTYFEKTILTPSQSSAGGE